MAEISGRALPLAYSREKRQDIPEMYDWCSGWSSQQAKEAGINAHKTPLSIRFAHIPPWCICLAYG
jgi:hypothetical protein